MKRLLLIFLLSFFITFPVSAQENEIYEDHHNILDDYELSEGLDENAENFFEKNDLDPANYNWVNNLNNKNVFKHIAEIFKGSLKKPLKICASLLSIIMITAALSAFGTDEQKFAPAIFAATLAIALILAKNIWETISVSANTIKGCSTFMFAFIPIFAVVTTLSGGTATSTSMSALLLGASETVSALASYVIVPMMGGYLALSISSSVSPLINQSGVASAVKKVSLWIMSLVSTVFTGILGIQTAVNSAADSLSIKTAKFIVGTSVPVAGTALSEATGTIYASMSLLRSSVGIYGVVALALTVLPIVLELLIWRGALIFCAAVAEMFNLSKSAGLLRAVDTMLSVLVGILLLVAGMFIIALTVVITVGKTQ